MRAIITADRPCNKNQAWVSGRRQTKAEAERNYAFCGFGSLGPEGLLKGFPTGFQLPSENRESLIAARMKLRWEEMLEHVYHLHTHARARARTHTHT